jgi:exoribonuclease-2
VMQPDPYQLGLSVIVKALHIFDGELDASLVYQALVSTGVFPPWQDLFSHFATSDLLYGLQEPLPEVAEHNVFTREAPSAMSKSPPSTTNSPAITSLGPDEFHPYDLADSIRHDFGDMAAYVIDDIGAEELDDAISFEPIPSEPDSAWVHVHIADPTALIHPNHNVAQFACMRGETAYFLQQTWPMLPDGLGLSLNSTADRAPQRVLTFSIKVDSKGDIADYKVRPGLVKNFVQLDYDSADFAMGLKPPRKHHPFGAEDIPQPSVGHLKQGDVDNLHALKQVADRLVTARLRLPVYFQSTHKVLLSLSPKPLISPSFDITKHTSFRGFPRITYGVSTIKDLDSGSRRLVSEMMKIACRVASVFCIDHDVPVLRRSSGRPLAKSDSDLEALLALRDDNGYIDFLDALSLEAASPPAEYTLKPKMHWGLGVPEGEGYVRVTSPLRRYDDMVSHWQIKHALLGSLGAPPFSADYLLENAKEVTVRQARRKQTINSHEKFWTMICVSRWMQERRLKETRADPLADLTGVVLRLPTWEQTSRGYHCLVRLPTLGINGVLCGLTDIADVALGTRISVKVDAVKFGLMPQLRLVRAT